MSFVKFILCFTNSVSSENFEMTFYSQESAMRAADAILYSLKNVSLLSKLNDMQLEASYTSENGFYDNPVFNNKFTIPLYFVNLILDKYNMRIDVRNGEKNENMG